MDGLSMDTVSEKLEQLKQLMPEVFAEGKIDFQKLKLVLGERIATPSEEQYGLNWAGKYEAFKEIQKQTAATLIPDEAGSVDFANSNNIFIEGENFEVLRILQKSYYGKIKMIYIDPPYNTGNDSFVYPDDFSERQEEYKRRAGITNDEGYLNKQDLWKKNTRENGQFHSVWLSMMYPRLYLARNLMREDGVIFVSIDDNEQANLKLIMDEVFGEENFVAQLIWEKGRKNDAKLFSTGHEYVLVYFKTQQQQIIWREEKPGAKEILDEYAKLKMVFGEDYISIQKGIRDFYERLAKINNKHPSLKHRRYNRIDKNGIWRDDNISWPGGNGPTYDVIHPITEKPCKVPDGGWRFSTIEKFKLFDKHGFIFYREDHSEPPMLKRYLNYVSTDFDPDVKRRSTKSSSEIGDVNVQVMPSVFYKNAQPTVMALRKLMNGDFFPNPKDASLLKRWISYVSDKDAIILDFFAGSGSTAQAVLELNQQDGGNRQFILVQHPEPTDAESEAYKAGYKTIADICKARITKVIDKLKSAQTKAPELFEQEGLNTAQDLGFRSYELDYSNFKQWRADVSGKEAILNQLEIFQEPLEAYSTTQPLLVELLLKTGLPLNAEVEIIHAGEGNYYWLPKYTLCVALEIINEHIVNDMVKRATKRIICMDSCFAGNDVFKTNIALQLEEAKVKLMVI